MCDWSAVQNICRDLISVHNPQGRTVVFAETKRDCGDIASFLQKKLSAVALHGDIDQSQREVTLKGFRDFKYNVLVATDVAARGLDISGIELVIQIEPPKDVESYIHRSGRTGRAGASGTCILLCGQRKAGIAVMIERNAKLKFERIHAPQPSDLAHVSAAEAAEKVRKVKSSVAKLFSNQAQELIDSVGDQGIIHMVAAAIACIAGHGDLTSRSLLTSREGYTTILFKSDGVHIRSASFVFTQLRRLLPEEEVNDVTRMTLTKSGDGAVFDLPCKKADKLLEMASNRSFFSSKSSLSICEELPELIEKAASSASNGSYSPFRGGARGGARGGGYRGGGRASSRGRGRGGGRGRR